MAHQVQLEKNKYRQWVKAGLGLGYLKEGLAPFCHDIAKQQHKDILDIIQRTKSLPLPVTCGTCQLRSLKPDHVKTGNKVCPYGQSNCNCWFPNGKKACQNKICGAIYDFIVQNHVSKPSAPNWRNTDSQLWTIDSWSIAKCFINAPGYDQKEFAADTDCTGLLHVVINNKYFHNHIACNLIGASIFSKVRDHRNQIFHSSSQELEEKIANACIDDIVTVLQDSKELVNQPDAQQAVQKLQDLKNKDFIITSDSHEELLKQIRENLMHELNELKAAVSTKEEVEELERKISNIEELLEQTRDEIVKSKESTKELLKQTKDEMMKSTESTKELLKQTKDEMVKSTESTKELLKQTKDEMVKSTESAKVLLKQTKDEILKSTESNKKNYKKLKRKIINIRTQLSEQKVERKRPRVEVDPEQKQLKYEKAKAEWRTKIIQEYRTNVLKVPAMPLLPDEKCEFSRIYVRPKIIIEVKDENRKTKEIEIKSMSEIFTRNDVSLKSVYVVGDAGTGKSSFCKYLVTCWCMAHNNGQIVDDTIEGRIEEDEFNSVNEMKKFEFLFFISLRHNQGIDGVREMLKNQYDIDILGTLLEKESEKVIILLDGLDEWYSEGKTYNQFQKMGLPKLDVYKKYTIVTTSRPWKIHTLRISDAENQQLLKLKGFDDKSETEMIKRTVSNINYRKGECKNIDDCRRKLREESLRSLKEVPIMLQQLICLWFDGKLDKTSRSVVYTEILELFFTWNDDKTVGTISGNCEYTQNVELPECIADKEICELNSLFIFKMSQLAYQTLFNCPKDMSLSFDISVFRKLKISVDIIESCLRLGILTKDRCPSLFLSERPKSMFSFIHKSVQEFLAAVYMAMNVKTNLGSANSFENEDFIQFVKEFFKNCSSISEILEHSNVIIMICSLEPRLASHVSKHIYDIVKGDELVQIMRRTVYFDKYGDGRCITDIQKLLFDSMKECNACSVDNYPTFYIGDLIIVGGDESGDFVCSKIDQRQIAPDFVHSIYVEYIDTYNVKFSKYLPNFKHLEKIDIWYDTLGHSSTENVHHIIDEVNNSVAEVIIVNASTLKSLSINTNVANIYNADTLNLLWTKVLCILPSMQNLVAIMITRIKMKHTATNGFCEFLEGTGRLEKIHIYIKCECENEHGVDLSNHKQLQYLHYSKNDVCATNFYTANLEVFKCLNMTNTDQMKIFGNIGKCDKLKGFELSLDYKNKSQLFHTSITEKLVLVLPLLHNLNELRLVSLRFTDNIVQIPSEMKSLKHIELSFVTMSFTTFRKFVDSLPSIPHSIDVKFSCCFITGDDEEFNDGMFKLVLGGGEGEDKANDARKYVNNQKQLFYVKHDNENLFIFSTTKI